MIRRFRRPRCRIAARAVASVAIVAALLGPLLVGAGRASAADGAYRIVIGSIDSSRFPEVRFSATVIDQTYVPVADLGQNWDLVEDGKPVKVMAAAPIVATDN